MESKEVPLEEVGNAEAVLNRLIHERKSLEAAGSVLQTYRMVRSELQPAKDELVSLQRQVESVKRGLGELKETYRLQRADAEQALAVYKEKQAAVVEGEIDAMKEVLKGVTKEFDAIVKEKEREKVEFEKMMDKQEREYKEVEKELMEMKVQHAALAEAIGKAAAFFKQ